MSKGTRTDKDARRQEKAREIEESKALAAANVASLAASAIADIDNGSTVSDATTSMAERIGSAMKKAKKELVLNVPVATVGKFYLTSNRSHGLTEFPTIFSLAGKAIAGEKKGNEVHVDALRPEYLAQATAYVNDAESRQRIVVQMQKRGQDWVRLIPLVLQRMRLSPTYRGE
jgi:hypothetical protein